MTLKFPFFQLHSFNCTNDRSPAKIAVLLSEAELHFLFRICHCTNTIDGSTKNSRTIRLRKHVLSCLYFACMLVQNCHELREYLIVGLFPV